MSRGRRRVTFANLLFTVLISLLLTSFALAQSTATLQGTVSDSAGGVLVGAKVVVRNQATGLERTVQTDNSGNYQVAALPVGVYRVEAQTAGFSPQSVTDLRLEVSNIVVQNFQLKVGDVSQTVSVAATGQVLETSTITVGQVIDQKTVQEIPLNGRHFVDLGLLIPGSVTPPQSGFLTAPLRGQGSFAFNTAGQREDTVNFMINGINLNDQSQNQITFQPSINTVQEFKADNSTYSAEYGRNSGAIVNIATRSGANQYHGEIFEFLRNDVFDARNFFYRPAAGQPSIPPFKRNQFGAAVGGPIFKEKTFFFFSYEGTRQRQGLTTNSQVPSDVERARATNPVVLRLLDLIPRSNGVTALGNAVFSSSATAPVDIDQWTGDVSHTFNAKDRLHGYYAIQRDNRGEPTLQGSSIPGFGDTRQARRQILTLNETHIFSSNLVNEVRVGFNRIRINFTPNVQLNPRDLGIINGVNEPIGLPQIIVDGTNFNFGGPANFPQGRADTTAVVSNTLNYLRGRHSFKFGGEFRRFYNNNFTKDTGVIRFVTPPTPPATPGNPNPVAPPPFTNFIDGNASSFNITLGSRSSSIATGALGSFVQDSFKLKSNLTVEVGLRYDWNMTPSERYNRFAVFDLQTASLVQIGSGIDQAHRQNNKNFQPRFGFAWNPFKNNKAVVRGGYAILTDQPVTNLIAPLASNPPFASPINITTGVTLSNPLPTIPTGGLIAPNSVDRNFENAYVQSWNLNLQREITPNMGIQIGYFGSKGTHLRISRNINQGVTSPVNTRLYKNFGNITEISSGGNSSYNALWISANRRLVRGLQFNGSYTWSKSIDYNSLNSQGVVLQDSNNIRSNRGLSDYDARHRFVISALYELPFRGNRLKEGWQVSTITQLQSGNPVSIVTNLGTLLTGVNNTGRPDLIGNLQVVGDPNQWFTNGVCSPTVSCQSNSVFFVTGNRFGNLGRNVVTGPDFKNIDFSILKNTKIKEGMNIQVRAEVFDLFNHANFGQPGTLAAVNSTNFGVITTTRFPTGDSGSSRQMQLALKFTF